MVLNELYQSYGLQIEIIYGLVLFIFSFFIAYKANKLYNLSNHRGLRLFSLSFFFFGLSFLLNLLNIIIVYIYNINLTLFGSILFHIIIYTPLNLSGFYLVCSLVWKDNLNQDINQIRTRNILLFILAIFIASIDFIINIPSISKIIVINQYISFGFISQLIVLGYGSFISYNKYQIQKTENKKTFLQVYFIVFVLMFIGWFLNYLSFIFENPGLRMYVIIITTILLMMIIFGIIKPSIKQKIRTIRE